MNDQSPQGIQIHKLIEGSFLFCSPQGNILFGCPPEILKRILALHLPMPDTIVLPENLHHNHSSQSSLEFPFYHFLFVQRGLDRGRQFQVVANTRQCKGVEELLRVTVTGPTAEEMVQYGTPPDLAREIYQETYYLCLKNPKNKNKPYIISEMVNFNPLSTGERTEVYKSQEKFPAVLLERTGDATFRVLYGEDAYDLDLRVSAEQKPNYKINHQKFNSDPGRFEITVLGRSNGFDPNDPANGYLLNIDGKIVLWDCPAYLHQHLKAMGIDAKDIDAFILSHVHEDHIDTSESLRDPPMDLYTTPEIYYSLLVKLSGVFGCSLEEAKKYHRWHPIDINKPNMEIVGAQFSFFHSVHAIPALGVRIEKDINGSKGLLHISGDHLSQEALKNMYQNKGISERRFKQVNSLLNGMETLTLMDVGGGAIHGDYREFLGAKGRMRFMHTGLINDELPEGMELVKSGQVMNVME